MNFLLIKFIFTISFIVLATRTLSYKLEDDDDRGQNEQPPTPKTWALLVAGSNEYYNYRHQADIFHAYQILRAHKIPDENIIMMYYGDIAHSSENPTPGIVINHPNGSNVFKNIPKDYLGKDVTPENFINILSGNETAMRGIGSGKVIKSTKNDRVFVNFVDHGGPGVLCFPDGELTVGELHAVLKKLHQRKTYADMVLYIEACESGSMFRNLLPTNMNIFVTTASNYNESSYACYFDEIRDTYLGDCYSVNWMEDTDQRDINQETLYDQYLLVKKETNLSHVMEFGDLTIAMLPVADFQGEGPAAKIRYPKTERFAIPAHDVPLQILKRKLAKYNTKELKIQYKNFLKRRQYVEKIFTAVVDHVALNDVQAKAWLRQTSVEEIKDLNCHTELVHTFSKTCFNFGKSPYALRFIHTLAHMCNDGVSIRKATKVFRDFCSPQKLLYRDGIQ